MEQGHEVPCACHEKERAINEAGVAEKRQVDVRIQRDRDPKDGRFIPVMATTPAPECPPAKMNQWRNRRPCK